ncbi:MAG: FtsX-like permease family protein [Planctomycetota bacterium]|nr:MAG: FtsX-like permease family protein [Planctomycetota bacterium]
MTLPDGAIPAFGDEAAVQWQLHSGLGKSIVVTSLDGEVAQLRFVGLLRNSPLQDEIIISEANFKRSFPAIDGYRFFLIDAPVERADAVASILEQTLGDYGFDVGSTSDRLRDYLAVQNTYITTFQTLGGLGLGLGAFGIVAVLLRNIWERRSELALMQALGFARGALVRYVLAENAMLVATGLLCGVLPAMLAIAPTLLRRPGDLSWASLAASVGAVVFVGVGVGFITTRAALRTPLIPALRRE